MDDDYVPEAVPKDKRIVDFGRVEEEAVPVMVTKEIFLAYC
jgi:hypothetical protein